MAVIVPPRSRYTPIRTKDPETNRNLDELARLLNPLLARTWDDRLSLNETHNQESLACWDDLATSALAGSGAATLTQNAFPEAASPFQALFMSHLTDDTLSFVGQMSHRWNRGPIRPHIHIVPCSAPAGTEVARFSMRYAWSTPYGPVPPLSAWGTRVVTVTIQASDYLRHKVADFGLLPPDAGAGESSLFFWSVTRTGTDPGDTYTTNKSWGTGAANLMVGSFDIHYQAEKAGTSTERPERSHT